MRALLLQFETPGLAVGDAPDPGPPGPGEVRLKLIEGGICGTDRSLAAHHFGAPPPGESQLILGHEAVAVIDAIGGGVTGFQTGDYVTPLVRRPCLPGCAMCARGRRDNCLTGQYIERGIFGQHGYLCQFALDRAEDLVKVPSHLADVAVLVEPMSVVAKAWELAWNLHQGQPQTALILGAGAIGILAAFSGLLQGLEITVLSQEAEDDPRAILLRNQGVQYTRSLPAAKADIILEACGDAHLAVASLKVLNRCGVQILLGARAETITFPYLDLIIANQILAGSVNAAPAHFAHAVADLERIDRRWLHPLLHRIPLAAAPQAILNPPPGVVKSVPVVH